MTEAMPELRLLRAELEACQADVPSTTDADYALQACALGYDALLQGNFGVGALLVGPTGKVMASGHNEMFYPSFRSDRHAEMVVMERFENANASASGMLHYILYTSLEPCPMCLVRLISAGIGTVKYVATDPEGGMARKINALPSFWRSLADGLHIIPAEVSPSIARLAEQLFLFDIETKRQCLLGRRNLADQA
jgi:cytosine deaminase